MATTALSQLVQLETQLKIDLAQDFAGPLITFLSTLQGNVSIATDASAGLQLGGALLPSVIKFGVDAQHALAAYLQSKLQSWVTSLPPKTP